MSISLLKTDFPLRVRIIFDRGLSYTNVTVDERIFVVYFYAGGIRIQGIVRFLVAPKVGKEYDSEDENDWKTYDILPWLL